MPRRKKKLTINAKVELKFLPVEWARMKGLNEVLFVYWQEPVTEKEFEEIKKKVMRWYKDEGLKR